MLIVVSIILILMAMTTTMMRPAGESRRIREAARSINVYLSSARNRAIETGRPCGVILRNFGTLGFAMNLDQCEVPPCYAGDMETSMIDVTSGTVSATSGTISGTLSSGDAPFNLLKEGDLIQFNLQGPCYPLEGNPTDADDYIIPGGSWVLNCYYDRLTQNVPWNGQSVPYRIFRSPIKGAAAPLQLPAATVIDFTASGVDGSSPPLDPFNANDVTILFSPNGGVDRVYVGNTPNVVTEPIFLLVGKRERVVNTFQVDNPNESTLTNYQDLNNLWITVNPQTGLVNTEPVAAISIGATEPQAVAESRLLAREAQGMGGK